MFGSTHTIRRLAGLSVVAGAFAALSPVAQADSGFKGEPRPIQPPRQARWLRASRAAPATIERSRVGAARCTHG